MSDEERLQNLVAELRIMESYYNDVASRQNLLARIMAESRAASEAVKNFPKTGTSEILLPIGGGIYMRIQAPPPESLVVSIGAEVAVEKSLDNTIVYLDERLEEIEKAISNLEAQKVDLGSKINSKRIEINSLIETAKPS